MSEYAVSTETFILDALVRLFSWQSLGFPCRKLEYVSW